MRKSDRPDPSCRFLEWDSAFFGVRVARLFPRGLTPAKTCRAFAWCRRRRIDCVYFLADADDAASIRIAEDRGFRLMDLRVTLERGLSGLRAPESPRGVRFRLGADGDVPALETIAKTAHRDSRFYADPRFSRSRCDELYRTWIRKSCRGGAEAVWVAELRGSPVGYVTCHLREGRPGEIGLVGVSAKARGRGVGRRLLFEALRWFSRQGVERVSVVTQGRNAGAQRLYQRAGFTTRDIGLSYHVWLRGSRAAS